MDQPKGFEDPSRPNNVCRLLKCIFGLEQASRSWNEKFDKFLTLFGFVKSSADPCIYYQKKGEVETILAIWVDDGLLCGTDRTHLDEVLRYLNKHFEITSKDVDCFVGISIKHDRTQQTIQLTQPNYIKKILKRFQMENCDPKLVPADLYTVLSSGSDKGDSSFVDRQLYQEAVGSLMFLMVSTRPDIAFAVGQVSQFCQDPQQAHWKAVKRIMAYLRGTCNYGIIYGGADTSNCLTIYSDADYAGDVDTRRSIFLCSMEGQCRRLVENSNAFLSQQLRLGL